MSSKAPQEAKKPDEWQPRRTHAVVRRFYRKDKKRRFFGQQADEEIRLIVREHPLFYFTPAIPLLLSLAFMVGIIWLGASSPLASALMPVLNSIGVIAVVVTGFIFAYRLFERWWVNVDIITNKRVLTWKGLLQPTRNETTLDKVQQIAVDQDSIFSVFLSYGTVHVYLAGGKALVLKNVPRPKKVRDEIMGIQEGIKEVAKARAAGTPAVVPVDKELSEVLAKLAAKEEPPKLPNADEKYMHNRIPTKHPGPLRRFGGLLRQRCEVLYEADEYTVIYLQRSRWLLAMKLFLPVVGLLACLVLSVALRVYFGFFAVAFVVLLVAIGLIILNYIDDVFILTNKRIIDIERKFFVLFEQHDTINYDKISKISVQSHNVIELALDIGDLQIWTQGSNDPRLVFSRIDHPFFYQDKIFAIKGFKEKADKIKASNERKAELNMWFGTVLTTLEKKMVSRGVPNLQSLDLWEAAARASTFGMRVVPVGESAEYPDIAPGKIVSQVPSPGTMLHPDSQNSDEKPQIRVVLSRRP